MKTLRIGLLSFLTVILSIATTSCESNEDEPTFDDNNKTTKTTYSINPTDFPKNLIITSIEEKYNNSNGTEVKITTEIEYDANNRILSMTNAPGSDAMLKYEWSNNICTVYKIDSNGNIYGTPYKAIFENNLMETAKWGNYTIKGVYNDNGRLAKLPWDSDGNLVSFEKGRYVYSYSNLENCYNVDLNIFLSKVLRHAWDDDGSSMFTFFGYTGVRSSNLISEYTDTEYNERNEIEYTLDATKRIDTITKKEYTADGTINTIKVFTIAYLE